MLAARDPQTCAAWHLSLLNRTLPRLEAFHQGLDALTICFSIRAACPKRYSEVPPIAPQLLKNRDFTNNPSPKRPKRSW